MEYLFCVLTSPGPIIINLGPFSLRWYGVLIALSVLIGLNLSNRLSKIRGIEKETFNDLLPFLVLTSLIGARIYYVLLEWRFYKYNLPEAFAIWKGGIAIHGALIGALFAIWVFCISRKQYFWDLLDVLAPSFALGQAIGRWGNFFNNEAFGLPTNLPWKLYIPLISRPIELSSYEYFHPTFLYESIWSIITFLILIELLRKGVQGKLKLPSGSLIFIYLTSYGTGRLWIERLRIDPLCIGGVPPFCEGGVRIAQLVSILLIGLGIFNTWWLLIKNRELPSLGTKREI